MTIKEYIEKYGSYNTARKLVEKRISMFGFSLSEMPDNEDVLSIVESVEQAITQNNNDELKVALSEIDMDWIENITLS